VQPADGESGMNTNTESPSKPIQRALLYGEREQVVFQILEFLGDLDVVEILRRHTPPGRHHLVDRLETALRLLDRIHDEMLEVPYDDDDDEET
jgi:hypothetical protein